MTETFLQESTADTVSEGVRELSCEGLTQEQVQDQIAQGKINTPVTSSDITLKDIICENVLTYFNLIFLIITVCLCLVRSYRSLTFLPVIIANIFIGIIQEYRSKSLLDRLKIMTQPKTVAVRDGQEMSIPAEELVCDDLIRLDAGNQIPADAVVVRGEVMVNEALLTGEADLILKAPGGNLLSGSFVVSGNCYAKLTRVGSESYSAQLTIEAKAYKKKEESEMIRSLNRLVRIVGFAIIPIAGVLFWQQYYVNHSDIRTAVTGTVAAVLGMIPEGLFLLASVAMAVSAMRLALGKVLVHNMKSIETLARVDVLCVDKTGTITEQTMTVKDYVPLAFVKDADAVSEEGSGAEDKEAVNKGSDTKGSDNKGSDNKEETLPEDPEKLADIELAIGDFAACMSSDNITIRAIKERFPKQTGRRPEKILPFSPVYKFSAAVFAEKTYVLGSPERILREDYPIWRHEVEKYSVYGYRVLVFAQYEGIPEKEPLTEKAVPIALILLANPIRPTAPETFRYFEEQQVCVKVISGDHPLTVSEVAREAGISGADRFIDTSALTDEELRSVCDDFTVFGRVTPQQKRILIRALQEKGHTVAMTGDGVNDVLALKDADCSIAMASGSDAAVHAAQMVLLDSDFSRMPSVVTEGRRVVNNIERTASLFLVKNIFSLLMSVFSIILAVNYPLEPSQVSLISMFTIGIPAFFLSLETNRSPITGHFLGNVFFKALPAGLTDFAVISSLVVFCQEFAVSGTDLSTSCTILLAIVGIMILFKIMSPMTKTHWVLWFAMIAGILIGMTFLNHVFAITAISGRCAMLLIVFAIITEPSLRYLSLLTGKFRDFCGRFLGGLQKRRAEQEKLFADMK